MRNDHSKTGDFWIFRDRFKSSSAPSSKTEVMTDSKFGVAVLAEVDQIHSWTEIMLLLFSIVPL